MLVILLFIEMLIVCEVSVVNGPVKDDLLDIFLKHRVERDLLEGSQRIISRACDYATKQRW